MREINSSPQSSENARGVAFESLRCVKTLAQAERQRGRQ